MATENTDTVSTYIDEADASTTYIGIAPRKSSITSPVWQIKRILVDGTVTSITYPNGDDGFKYIWDDRDSYTYE